MLAVFLLLGVRGFWRIEIPLEVHSMYLLMVPEAGQFLSRCKEGTTIVEFTHASELSLVLDCHGRYDAKSGLDLRDPGH